MKTVIFLALALVFINLETQSQIIIRHQIDISSLEASQIEEFAEKFTKEVLDSLTGSKYSFSVEHMGVTLTECEGSSLVLIYEARLYEAYLKDAENKIIRFGSVVTAKNALRAQKKGLRRTHKESEGRKTQLSKTYGRSAVKIMITSDRTVLCHNNRTICLVDKFIIIKKIK